MTHGGDSSHRGLTVPKGRFQESGRFGRKFPHLRSLKSCAPENAVALGSRLVDGKPGPMNGGTEPVANPRIAAGFTFLGQFIDHDVTLDTTSSLEQQNDPQAIQNFRTPAFELDSVYGLGPKVQPYLYDGDAFVISDDGVDLQRNRLDVALIGDPRNDENLIINQLHLTFLKFHNAVRSRFATNFEEAQSIVRWHYQWIVLNEFLRLTVGDEAVEAALARPDYSGYSQEAFMPVEFAVAAYRFGHTQIRPGYRINRIGENGFAAAIFPTNASAPKPTKTVRSDLRGGPVGPDFAIDWSIFFGDAATRSNLIDTKLSEPLLNLPFTVVADSSLVNDAVDRSLAVRNLKRGISFGLPAGETIAAFYGIPALTPAEIGGHPGTEHGTPLWFYILKEAEVRTGGQHLAGVGARIVAEVFVDLLRMDTASFLASDPGWKPTLPSATPGKFLMTDLIAIANA